MTAYPAWTPASRPGIIPLHPLSFGTILGRSFAALRQNPKVLLGFAMVVQTVAYLVVIGLVAAIAGVSFSRLDTVAPGTEEFETIMAGSIAITAIAGLVLGLAAGVLGVIVQGIVVIEVTHAAVAEKLALGALWRQLRPAVWRLIGYTALLVGALLAAIALLTLGLVAIGLAALPVAIGLTVLVILGAIPLVWWLTIKLLLAPAAIIIERATITGAIARSWTLTRGRFWPALGVILLISLVFGAVAQVVSLPMSFLSAGLGTIIAPTGEPTTTEIIGLVVGLLATQAITLLLQAVLLVVQSSATALIYIDARMRREGLDLDLLAYVERRDAGSTGLADPFVQNIGRVVAPRAAAVYAAPGYTPAGPPPPGYPAASYGPPPAGSSAPQPGYGVPAGYAVPPQPGYTAAPPPGYAAAPPPGYAPAPLSGYAAAPEHTAAAPVPAADSGEPAPTIWAAPGSSGADSAGPTA